MIFLTIGVKLISKKEINANRFSPGWEGNQENSYKKFEEINKKGHLSLIGKIMLIACLLYTSRCV